MTHARQNGFTLVEVLVSAVILAIAFTALVAAFGHDSVTTVRGEEVTQATFLADEIHDMALRLPLASVLALNNQTYNPAILSTGSTQGLTNWSQKIAASQVSAADLNAAGTGAAKLTVEVRRHGKPVLTQVYYVVDMNGVPFTDRGQ